MNYFLIIIAAVIALFFLMQIWIVRKTISSKGKELNNISGEIGKAIAKYQSLVLYFFTPTCAACRKQTPIVEELKKSFPNIISVDLSKGFSIGRQLGVMATPTTLVIENKVIKEVFLGAQRKEKILSYLR
jgi:thiol-disulfide isomerase/thioredoxin